MQHSRSMMLCILLALVIRLDSPACAADEPASVTGRGEASELRERFGEQQFHPAGGFVLRAGRKLPPLVWESPQLVRKVVKDAAIPTRWFNERLEEVTTAKAPGRYYAYGEAPTPSGPPLRRAMTCCCVSDDIHLPQLAAEWVKATEPDADDERRRAAIAETVKRWQTSDMGAVDLAAWLEGNRQSLPPRIGQWQMEDATRHVRLKRKLMGLSDRPLVKAPARPLAGDPAPVLRSGSLESAGITQQQRRAISDKLEEWFADSQEPMAVVIARNGVIVVAEGFGAVDGQAVTIDTPMRLDSAMKPLIGLQLATYVDRGILKLDEPIGNYLPDFDTPRDRHLTFRAGHVHATGIHFPWELAFRRLFYFHTWHESLIAHCRREWEPGTRHRYGVVGVILSVRALELLRGRNYWDAMERDLFRPLGIHNVLPGGRGFSAESMARIGVLLDNGGRYGAWELFSEETHRAILPTSLKPYLPELDMEYGIGLKDASGHLGPGSYGHGGGCGTVLAVNPDKHVVFAMVRNAPGKNYRRHRSELSKLLRAWLAD